MKRVIIESPYHDDNTVEMQENMNYARAVCLDAVQRGEVPFASHLFFTLFLDDQDPAQRKLGIEMGYDFWEKANLIVFYMDRGMSPGMKEALAKAFVEGKPYEQRYLVSREQAQKEPGPEAYAPKRLRKSEAMATAAEKTLIDIEAFKAEVEGK